MPDTQVQPEVGMGVTQSIGSDSYPYTIIEVKHGGKTLVIQSDDYKRTDNNGYGGHQEYEYAPNPNGSTHEITLRKTGRYKRKGESLHGGYNYGIGFRRAYQDPHF